MAAKPKRKQKPKNKLTDKGQSERFKETARNLGIRDNDDFGRFVEKIAPIKKQKAR
jgi:hypothetical protein